MDDLLFLSAVRTGFGSFGGSLVSLTATDLAVAAGDAALIRSGIDRSLIGHVVVGNVMQTSNDAIYCARHVGLRTGLPVEVPAVTVNRLCGSGFEAIIQGGHRLSLGETEAVLVGGTESMSQAPHVLRGARWGIRYGSPPPLEDSLATGLHDPVAGCGMADTAENLARDYGITRRECEEYAARSQQAAAMAWHDGLFADEVVAVTVRDARTRQDVEWARDEHIRADTTADSLARLKPVTGPQGTVTAGTASGINDGAAMLVMATDTLVNAHGLRPIGRLVAWGAAGVAPDRMGIGPVPAARKALAAAGMTLADMTMIEINEAFAAQYLAVERELGLDRDRTNIDGGAIAIGHPLGASGARITAHLLHGLRQRGGGIGLGAACIGGGQGIAVIIEAFPG